MSSHKKLELSRETLRSLTSDLPSERLADVQGGGDAGADTTTCISCLDCVTDTIVIAPTWVDTGCWTTR